VIVEKLKPTETVLLSFMMIILWYYAIYWGELEYTRIYKPDYFGNYYFGNFKIFTDYSSQESHDDHIGYSFRPGWKYVRINNDKQLYIYLHHV